MNAEAQAPGGLLARIVEEARRRARALRPYASALERQAAWAPRVADFEAALHGTDVAVIAEVKRRSPSSGPIRPGARAGQLGRLYLEGGAAAISVLTEPKYFGGALSDLSEVASATGLAVLRKDFVVDRLQLLESRAAGASAVLLIARVLRAEELGELAEAARAVDLVPLIEVHNADELALALRCGPAVIGVNSRDLDTLDVDTAAALALLQQVPEGVTSVAESGVSCREDVARAAAAGADAVLVGTSVAGAVEPAAAVRALTGVRRKP